MPCLYGITFAVSDIAKQRPAVERVVERDDRRSARWRTRAILTAFSTASAPEFAKNVFFGASTGRQGVQPLRQLDGGLVRRDVGA